MKLAECKDWKYVKFDDRTIAKADCKYMSSLQLHYLAETEVKPTKTTGYYIAVNDNK